MPGRVLKPTALPPAVESAWAGKRVLITGGAGFLGSNLAHALVPLGAQVVLLDALLPLYGGNRYNVAGIESAVEFVEGDIRDAALVAKLVAGQDYIFNLAAQVSYLDSKEQPHLDLDINGRGHLTVLEAVRRLAPQARVIFSSSRLVYGKILRLPVGENHPTDPLSVYGIHKLLGEKYYWYYHREFGIPTVSIRIPNPYGPRQQMKHTKYSIVGWFIRQAMTGGELTIYGDGQQTRDYLYVDDIVSALLRVAVGGTPGAVYNIGTDERIRFVDMVSTVVQEVERQQAYLKAARRARVRHVPWPPHYEKNETGDYVADTTRIQADTGWQATVPLTQGIATTVKYYHQHHRHYW